MADKPTKEEILFVLRAALDAIASRRADRRPHDRLFDSKLVYSRFPSQQRPFMTPQAEERIRESRERDTGSDPLGARPVDLKKAGVNKFLDSLPPEAM